MMERVERLIQGFNAAIPGIRWADWPNPRSLTTDDLPATLTFLQLGRYKNQGGLITGYPTARVDVLYCPATQEIYEEARVEVARLHDAVASAYLSSFDSESHYLDYGDTSGIQVFFDRNRDIEITGFKGDIKWLPDIFYFGFTLVVPLVVRRGDML